MSNLFVSPVVFERARARWDEWAAIGCPGLDSGVEDAVRLLNTLPGVATMWCCEGHPQDYTRSEDPMDSSQIVGVMTEEGFKHVMEIFERVQQANLMGDHEDPNHWLGGVVRLEFKVLSGMVLGIDGYYPIWALESNEGLDVTSANAAIKEAVSSYHRQWSLDNANRT